MELTEEQLDLFHKLTPLQKGVAMARVNNPTWSNVRCYVEGGGEAKSYNSQLAAASVILRNVNVKKFLDSMRAASANPLVMGREEMLERLSIMARTELPDVLDIRHGRSLMDLETGEEIDGESVWTLKPLDEMANGGSIAINELKVTRDGYQVKLHDQRAAMKQLAELQGFDAPIKHEVSGEVRMTLDDFYGDDDDNGES